MSKCQKLLAKALKCLQNLLLHARQYDFSLKYKPEKEIPLADALSWAPSYKPGAEELMIDNNLMMHPINYCRLSEIRSKTLKDPIMKVLAEMRLLLQASLGTKEFSRFLKTILQLQGQLDSTRWTNTKRTENSHVSCYKIRNKTKMSCWTPRHLVSEE